MEISCFNPSVVELDGSPSLIVEMRKCHSFIVEMSKSHSLIVEMMYILSGDEGHSLRVASHLL